MPPVGFEPTISAGERPKTYVLDREANGTGFNPLIILAITSLFTMASLSARTLSINAIAYQVNTTVHSLLTAIDYYLN
jgi:hypothetical protein